MKATGIVRRIDDLGRVVIPKEIRRTLRIREGDPLEIYTEKDGEVIFKKYSPMGDLGEFAGQICESIGKNTGYIAAVCDRDAIIAVHGVQKRELLDKRCSQELEQLMELRRSYRYQDGDLPVRPTDASDRYRVGAAAPIVTEGDLMGCVLILSEDGSCARGGRAASRADRRRLSWTADGKLNKQAGSRTPCLSFFMRSRCRKNSGEAAENLLYYDIRRSIGRERNTEYGLYRLSGQ